MHENQFSATGYGDVHMEHACGHLIKWLPLKPAAEIELILIIAAVQLRFDILSELCTAAINSWHKKGVPSPIPPGG